MRFCISSFALALALGLAGPAAPLRAETGDEQFAAAADLYSRQEWQPAAEAFAKWLTANPNHARSSQAQFFYGETLVQLGRGTEARQQFAALLKRDANGRYARQALFRSGEAAYLAGDDQAAKTDLTEFHRRFPDDELNGYALAYLGSIELQAGNAAAAADLFSSSLDKFKRGPLVDECRLGLAQAHEHQNRTDQARAEYRELAEGSSPLADQAMLHLGNLENSLGDYAAAQVTFERLAARFPDGALRDKAQLGRAYAFYKAGQYPQACALVEPLCKHATLGVEAHYWLGLAQKSQQQWSTAAATLLAGSKIDPKHRLNPSLVFHAADALLQEGQLPAADEQFDRVLTLWPDSPWADDCLLGKLRLATRQNDAEQCQRLTDDFTRRFADSSLRPQVDLTVAQWLVSQNKHAEAVTVLEGAIKRITSNRKNKPLDADPETRIALESALATCYARLGRMADARDTLAALNHEKTSPAVAQDTNYQVAEAAYAAGDLRLARDLFADLAQAEPGSDARRRGLSGVAWCHYRRSAWTEAAEAFNDLVRQYPDSPQAAEAALMRGRSLEHMDQLDPALGMFHLVLSKYPGSERTAEATCCAARLHDKLAQYPRAIELYGQLAERYPDYPELDAVLYRRAWLLRDVGKPDEAAQLWTKLRKDFPESRFATEAALCLAERAAAAGNGDQAKTLLADVTGSKASPALRQHAWYLQARVAVDAGRWADVESPLEQLIENYPDCDLAPASAYWMAEASYRLGNYEQAADRLAALAEKTKGHREPWSAVAELRRAQALAQLKQWPQSLEIAKAIAAQYPDFDRQHEADYLVGRALVAAADFDGAREAFGKITRSPRAAKTQTAAMAQWMMGESYFHQEQYVEALAEYAKVDEQYPFARWQAAALLQAGKCHELLEQWPAAVESYQRLLKTLPQSEFEQEARERLASAERKAHTSSPEPN